MFEMKYRTRGNSDPHGKSRVFFTCHPDDHEEYFEWTTDLLYKYQNCVVFYFEPAQAPEIYSALVMDAEKTGQPEESELKADLESRISEMQLIVVPVTAKLLTHKNLAMDVIYEIAVRRHIPVLPLMMETGLDDLFIAKFGDLQYLQPNNMDPTAIPFEERLEKYLNGVLVGDDLATRVRNAFDAYIFLSYRKKDRVFAQQLMRMIHRSKSCRDIAIWYDEFLVPGENFNSAIRTALRKSKLFTLVVTPNILEEGNYVMQYEYPEAKALEKGILPVEMKKTDPVLLRRFYAEFPECIGIEDQDTWDERFATYLKELAVDSNDEDPVHNFLIGLAYLDGIDVEVDSDKAVELITGAAETGLEEAVRKLVSMYHDGKGVARDYEVSAGWQEKLVGILEEKYKNSQSENDRSHLLSAVWDLGDAWFEMRRLKSALIAFLKMLAIALKGEQEEEENRICLTISYERLGDIEKALGHLEEAKEYYRKALEIIEVLAEETGTVESRRGLSVSYSKLGDIEKALGFIKEAGEYYRKTLKISRELAEETGTVEAHRDLSVSYDRVGDTEKAIGHLEEAGECYRKALKIREALAEETGTVEARRDLYISYSKLGDTEKGLGHLKEAGEYYWKDLMISEALVEETGTVEARRDLSVSYERLGDTEKEFGHLKEAGEYYSKSLMIREELVEETGTVEARRDLSLSYSKLGSTEEVLGHPEEAEEYYRKALIIREELAEETGTLEARRDLSISYIRLGDTEKAVNHLKEAAEYYRKALKINEELAEETGTVAARRDLSVIYNRLGPTEIELGNLKEAIDYYTKDLKLSEELAEEMGTVTAYRDLMISLYEISILGENILGTQYATEQMKTAVRIAEILANTLQTEQAYTELSVMRNYLNKLLLS